MSARAAAAKGAWPRGPPRAMPARPSVPEAPTSTHLAVCPARTAQGQAGSAGRSQRASRTPLVPSPRAARKPPARRRRRMRRQRASSAHSEVMEGRHVHKGGVHTRVQVCVEAPKAAEEAGWGRRAPHRAQHQLSTGLWTATMEATRGHAVEQRQRAASGLMSAALRAAGRWAPQRGGARAQQQPLGGDSTRSPAAGGQAPLLAQEEQAACLSPQGEPLKHP